MAPNVATRVVFKNILFATDFSEVPQRARLDALAIARRYDAKFSVVHVAAPQTQTPIPMEPVPLELDWQKKRAAQSLARFEDFEPLHTYPHQTVLKQGNPWLEISAIIADKGVDLMVLGTHGRGPIGKLPLGSVAEEALRRATCRCSRSGLTWFPACSNTSSCRACCSPLPSPRVRCMPFPRVVDRGGEQRRTHPDARDAATAAHSGRVPEGVARGRPAAAVATGSRRRQPGCKPQVVVENGAAAETIVRTAHDRQVDLMAMGVHRAGSVASHLPWTLVHSVVRHARCPVLTTR